MKSSRSFRSLLAAGVALFSGSAVAAPSDGLEFKAGPRDTVRVERSVLEEPKAQFAALTLDSAVLNGAGAEAAKLRASASRRIGPRGTIRRAR